MAGTYPAGTGRRGAGRFGGLTEVAAIGTRLREARKRRGLTQRELARLSGVSVSLVRKLEQDDYGNGLRLETVRKLAVALSAPTSALAAGSRRRRLMRRA